MNIVKSRPELLVERLNQIADSLANTGTALALLGLGSAGKERDRMDDYSDLDFFAIVEPGHKSDYLEDFSWLSRVSPVAYYFKNTADGCKWLYDDGVFCEFAVFEPQELETIPFAEGQVVWAREGFDTEHLLPRSREGRYQPNPDRDWQLGEALTNLYVGLGRYCRGERLSAFKFVQHFALDRLVDLMHLMEHDDSQSMDPFMPDRRLEARFIQARERMARFCQGYEQTPLSALAQLDWLEQNCQVSPFMAYEIRRLAKAAVRL
ncbi:hypothetical protein [Saccharospirillum salsuginis]|uniref:Nucleotidyltransferase domain-containing protein n=1 Tax=Saccharospirillum salsuginis TaxID=418750 RepID=A0A918KRX4_9GAMM|nr:hypothetical protein [Saccharospirillum salsuginis]GGX73539.1 hypothetical protein GCM10007392_46240 [Saccharospirillum salsuginis]